LAEVIRITVTTVRDTDVYEMPVSEDVDDYIAQVVAQWGRSRDGKVSFSLERLKRVEGKANGN
jgi:hypothetical protein